MEYSGHLLRKCGLWPSSAIYIGDQLIWVLLHLQQIAGFSRALLLNGGSETYLLLLVYFESDLWGGRMLVLHSESVSRTWLKTALLVRLHMHCSKRVFCIPVHDPNLQTFKKKKNPYPISLDSLACEILNTSQYNLFSVTKTIM